MGRVSQERAGSFNATEDRAGAKDQASDLYTGIPWGYELGVTHLQTLEKNCSVNGFSVTGILHNSFNCVVGQEKLTLRISRS